MDDNIQNDQQFSDETFMENSWKSHGNTVSKLLKVTTVLAALKNEENNEELECSTKEELEAKASKRLIDCDYDWVASGHCEQCVCHRKEPVVLSKKPDGYNWHLVSAWGDNTQDAPTTPVKQPKSGKKLKKTASSGSFKKGCFPSYFKHHLYYSTHMTNYKNFKSKHIINNSGTETETTREQMIILPDLSSKTIQLSDQMDPYLSRLASSQYVYFVLHNFHENSFTIV